MIDHAEYSGVMFVLVGPSGVGKNAIMKQVLQQRSFLRQLPTVTTRAIRPGEVEGREHFFVTVEGFREMVAGNELIEYQENYKDTFYGTPRKPLEDALMAGQKLIADIDVVGAGTLKKAFPHNVILIFIAPPSAEDLEARLRARGDTPESKIMERLEKARWELRFADECDYRVVNDTLEQSVQAVGEIINTELVKLEKA